MTTNEVCVTVCLSNVWQHVQKIHVPNWFPTVSDWFWLVSHHLFWRLCFKHRESWVIFGGICDEGPPVLDVLICSHFESTGLADPDKQTSESLGFELPAHQSCDIQTKLPNPWREPRVVRFQQDDLGLCHPPLSCRSLTLGQCAGTKMLKNVEKYDPPKRPKRRK